MIKFDLKSVLTEADKLAYKEIKKYDSPLDIHYEIANIQGQRLAAKMNADKDIVAIGTRLMDLKIGDAITKNKLPEHIKMSFEASRRFLRKFQLPKDLENKILNCVEAHHGTVSFKCIEAEICANADCYRMLAIKGLIALLISLGKREMDLDKIISYGEYKVDEKWKTLTFDFCKKELKENYLILKNLFKANKY